MLSLTSHSSLSDLTGRENHEGKKTMNRRTLLKLLSGTAVLPLVPATTLANTSQKRVILVELSGANDGLNTVAPFKDDRYHELRPTIALKRKDIITLDDYFGFNQALTELMPLWEKGDMAVIHGLGYPNPNRSHFKSIALWETGSDGNHERRNGWITHDIEHAYAVSQIDAHGISLSGGLGIFNSVSGNWLSMKTAGQFTGRSIESPATGSEQKSKMMKLLLDRAATLNASVDQIARKVENNPHPVKAAGGGEFHAQIAHAINLINSGIDSPVIKITLSGFDTHENQLHRHASLLKQLAKGAATLQKELDKTDNWNNTLVVSYSEFGRRAEQNKSNGTDHGTAAAHFIFGGNVTGGLHGQHPDLGNLENGDLQYTIDYRALYSSVIDDWLNLPTNVFEDYKTNELSGLFG